LLLADYLENLYAERIESIPDPGVLASRFGRNKTWLALNFATY
jgi:hypothetical protein